MLSLAQHLSSHHFVTRTGENTKLNGIISASRLSQVLKEARNQLESCLLTINHCAENVPESQVLQY